MCRNLQVKTAEQKIEAEFGEVVELDLDEIKTNVNKSVSDILNKYFSKM